MSLNRLFAARPHSTIQRFYFALCYPPRRLADRRTFLHASANRWSANRMVYTVHCQRSNISSTATRQTTLVDTPVVLPSHSSHAPANHRLFQRVTWLRRPASHRQYSSISPLTFCRSPHLKLLGNGRSSLSRSRCLPVTCHLLHLSLWLFSILHFSASPTIDSSHLFNNVRAHCMLIFVLNDAQILCLMVAIEWDHSHVKAIARLPPSSRKRQPLKLTSFSSRPLAGT